MKQNEDIGKIETTVLKMTRVKETYAVREIRPTRSGYKYGLIAKSGECVGFFKEIRPDIYEIVKIAPDNPQRIHLRWRIKEGQIEPIDL